MRAMALILALALLGAAFFCWRQAQSFLTSPAQSPGVAQHFDVAPGARLDQVARDLEKRGLISDAVKFGWLARWRGLGGSLKAGRFALDSGWTPDQVLNELTSGRPVLYRITVPEGLTWWQTARLLADNGFVDYEEFRKVIHDPAFLRHYGIPAPSAEGFLMPDTYLMQRPDGLQAGEDAARQARSVAGRLVDNFWRKGASLWTEGKKPGTADLMRLVRLASIVEKETGLAAERPRVAGVYANRLERGMLLQADPTVIYGLGPDFSGQLTRKNLEDAANSYNTYRHPGLPPGPIASFGADALAAAISPEKHDYLYFVASRDGGEHVFSRSLAEHNRAVRAYRESRRRSE